MTPKLAIAGAAPMVASRAQPSTSASSPLRACVRRARWIDARVWTHRGLLVDLVHRGPLCLRRQVDLDSRGASRRRRVPDADRELQLALVLEPVLGLARQVHRQRVGARALHGARDAS